MTKPPLASSKDNDGQQQQQQPPEQILKEIREEILLAIYTEKYTMREVPERVDDLVRKAYELGRINPLK